MRVKSSLILTLLIISLNIMALLPSSQAIIIPNPPITYKCELVATTNTDNPLFAVPEMGAQFNYTTEYEHSIILLFDKETNLDIVQGTICQPITQQTDIWMRDSLGNEYQPIINETTITNPAISDLVVPAFTTYTLKLHFTKHQNITITDGIYLSWRYNFLPTNVPFTLIARYPTHYTVLNTDTNNQTSDSKYTSLIWNFPQGEIPRGFVNLVPFPVNRIIRSFKVTGDILDYSLDSTIKQTIEINYDVKTEKALWKVPLNNINIPFPAMSESIEDVSVSDGQGVYEKLTTMPTDEGYTEQGYYFIDYSNRLVCIYARPAFEQKNVISQFYVKVTYEIGKLFDPTNITIPWWQPYRHSAGLAFYYNESAYWYLEMTDDFRIQFILPPQAILTSGDGFLSRPYEDNREIATRTYNSPLSIPQHHWEITFENIKLRDATYTQEASLIALIISLLILVILGKFIKFDNKTAYMALMSIIGIAPFGLFFVNFSSFYVLHWFPPFQCALLVAQFIVAMLIVWVAWHYYKKQKHDS